MSGLGPAEFEDNFEEELNYEYSDEESDELQFSGRCTPDYYSHSSKINYGNNEEAPTKLNRKFVFYEKVLQKVPVKNNWQRFHRFSSLTMWRLRSFDHVFNIHRKTVTVDRRAPSDAVENNETLEEEWKELSEVAIIVDNDSVKQDFIESVSSPNFNMCSPVRRITPPVSVNGNC